MGSGALNISDESAISYLTKEYDELKKEHLSDVQINEALKQRYRDRFVNQEAAAGEISPQNDIEAEKKYKERAKHLIMISLHVSSMEKSARILKEVLEAQGYRVWICTDMVGGVEFRSSIVQAVRECTVFIPLINNSWAQSGECSDEFSLAKRLHLTSHESGRTTRDKPRLPIFVPFAFSDLDWNAYPHIQLLAASTNFLVHDAPTLQSGNTQKRLDSLLLSMEGFGLSVDLPNHIIEEQKAKKVLLGGSRQGNTASTNGPHEQLIAITESLKAFASSIESVAYNAASNEFKMRSNNQGGGHTASRSNEENEGGGGSLSKEYLGVSNGSMVSTKDSSKGFLMQWWNSLHLKITKIDPSTNEVEGVIIESNLRKQGTSPTGEVVDGKLLHLQPSHPLYHWGKDLFVRVSEFKGLYQPDSYLLSGEATRVSEEANGVKNENFRVLSYKYHLVLRPSELVGVQMGAKSVSSMILKQIL